MEFKQPQEIIQSDSELFALPNVVLEPSLPQRDIFQFSVKSRNIQLISGFIRFFNQVRQRV
jgi:hypothetical protein